MPDVLHWISDVLPLSYAVDAMKAITAQTDPLRDVLVDVGIVAGFIVLALALASLTLSRRSA
jgi:ABC-2 type transport system permease protein